MTNKAEDELVSAIGVIVLTASIRDYLLDNDPNAFWQCVEALEASDYWMARKVVSMIPRAVMATKKRSSLRRNPISEVAKTIWDLISICTKMSCGARNAIASKNGISFQVGPSRSRLRVIVDYDEGEDLYTVKLVKFDPRTFEHYEIESHSGVYVEDLNEVIYHAVNK